MLFEYACVSASADIPEDSGLDSYVKSIVTLLPPRQQRELGGAPTLRDVHLVWSRAPDEGRPVRETLEVRFRGTPVWVTERRGDTLKNIMIATNTIEYRKVGDGSALFCAFALPPTASSLYIAPPQPWTEFLGDPPASGGDYVLLQGSSAATCYRVGLNPAETRAVVRAGGEVVTRFEFVAGKVGDAPKEVRYATDDSQGRPVDRVTYKLVATRPGEIPERASPAGKVPVVGVAKGHNGYLGQIPRNATPWEWYAAQERIHASLDRHEAATARPTFAVGTWGLGLVALCSVAPLVLLVSRRRGSRPAPPA